MIQSVYSALTVTCRQKESILSPVSISKGAAFIKPIIETPENRQNPIDLSGQDISELCDPKSDLVSPLTLRYTLPNKEN
jgi:hypothetical protein